MTMAYREQDGHLEHLHGKHIGVIGYGDLGQPVALNLRDSGVTVMVGARTDQTRQAAEAEGLAAASIDNVVQQAQVILVMLPNEIMPAVYLEHVSPHLRRGHSLIFSSGYNITYRFIEPPPFVDVGLIAPRIMGAGVREMYLSGQGYGSFVSVGQDASGQSWNTVLAVARAMGALKLGAIEVSFEQETELDLFAQQTLAPALHHLIKTAVDVLLARGYPPDAVFTELYLSGALAYYFDRVAQRGLLKTLNDRSLTEQYSAVSRMDRYYDLKLERQMEIALKEIHSGEFAREWSKEFTDGNRRLKSFYKTQDKLELWELEQQALEMLGRETDSE